MRIAIAGIKGPTACETFIRATIERLSNDALYLYGKPGYKCSTIENEIFPSKSNVARIRQMGQRRWKGYTRDQINHKAVASYLKSNKVEALLAHYAIVGSALAPAAEQADIPIIVHCHGYDVHVKKITEKYSQSYLELGRIASKVIAVSEKMACALETLGINKSKIVVRPCSVNLKVFRPIRPDKNKIKFLFVGRFVDKKAPYLTLLAFDRVFRAHPEAKLVMIGDGPLLETTRNLANSLGLESATEFTGSLSQKQIYKHIESTRAYVQHSITQRNGDFAGDSEGTPVAILEASASGLPVVSTRHGGITEAVIDGKTGLLVEERDVDGMAEAMLLLAKDPSLARSMGEAGRLHMESNYGMDQYMGTLKSIIKESCLNR